MTAFILSRLLLENSSFTLAVAMLLVFSDIVLETKEMDTPSLAEREEKEREGGREGGREREVEKGSRAHKPTQIKHKDKQCEVYTSWC